MLEGTLRLFVAIWPSSQVIKVLDGLARPDHPSVRWTGAGQWHVTLRFLGDVAEDELPALVEALAAVGSSPPRRVRVGPATARLGRSLLIVPVSGVDDLAQAVVEASGAFGRPVQERPFLGHLTLARGRGGAAVPEHLAGQPVEAAWMVKEVRLVRSHLGGHGARYETIATIPLHPENAHPQSP